MVFQRDPLDRDTWRAQFKIQDPRIVYGPIEEFVRFLLICGWYRIRVLNGLQENARRILYERRRPCAY
jgi:hypothetical protein